jgi:hypothetical protein
MVRLRRICSSVSAKGGGRGAIGFECVGYVQRKRRTTLGPLRAGSACVIVVIVVIVVGDNEEWLSGADEAKYSAIIMIIIKHKEDMNFGTETRSANYHN